MTVDVASRLPGITFQAVAPPSARVLPRMDVAAFAGFASGGPFDLPVAIEDAVHFAEVFGEDLALAIDPQTGEAAISQLGSAVRTFLRNGGVRCWVTRVGAVQDAVTTRFPIPGLLGSGPEGLVPVSLAARSPGAWADGFSIATVLDAAAAEIVDLVDGMPDTLDLRFATAATVSPGDLLRFGAEDWSILAPAISPPPGSGSPPTSAAAGSPPIVSGSGGQVQRIAFDRSRAVWIEALAPGVMPDPPLQSAASPPQGATLSGRFTAPDGSWHAPVPAWIAGPMDDHGRLAVTLQVTADAAPAPGTLVRLTGAGTRDLWLSIDSLDSPVPQPAEGSAAAGVAVVGAAWWVSSELPPGPLPAAQATAEVLTLELWAQSPGQPDARVSGLGLAPKHPRWLGDLPGDEQLYAPDAPPDPPTLWTDAQSVGLPLCGDGTEKMAVCLPLGIAVVPGAYLDAPTPPADQLTRSGVSTNSTDFIDAFVDADLAESRLASLGATADFIAYQQPVPRRLRGLHSVLALAEVTLLALPDAAQRQWTVSERPPLGPVTASTTIETTDPGEFAACGAGRLPAPVLSATAPDAAGRATLIWDHVGDDLLYLVQGSADPAQFAGAVELYDGPETDLAVDASRTGPYFRVRAHSPAGAGSDWSNGVAVDVAPPASNVISDTYDPGPLLAIQRAALRACAARGDILAALSLPSHYREDDALNHAAALRSVFGADLNPEASPVAPLDGSEAAALSYGMLYHPWPLVQLGTGAPLQQVVPDGPALGVFAERAIKRGAWIAAADEPLNDVVGLEPAIAGGRLGDLQAGRINVLRQQPGGFVCLDQDTLSATADLTPANVRRLLSLLRRLVNLYAPAYVFAVNDARLRRRIQRGFEANLLTMYTLGAFTGDTSSQAFQVVTGTPPNTQATAAQGQLIVELRVAPSLPMRFLTVRLVQGAAGDLQVQES